MTYTTEHACPTDRTRGDGAPRRQGRSPVSAERVGSAGSRAAGDREECRGGDDVPHEDLVEHLADRGAAQKQIDHWIDKCVEEGDIIEPDDGFYRR